MLDLHPRNAWNIMKKYLRYPHDISDMFGSNVKDIYGQYLKYKQNLCVICLRFAWDMPEICL